MATRNFYVKVAQQLEGRTDMIQMVFLLVAIGGFAMLLGNALFLQSRPVFEIGGSLWFTSTAVVGVANEASSYFNPVRDNKDVSFSESWFVFVLNCQLLIGVIPWFIS